MKHKHHTKRRKRRISGFDSKGLSSSLMTGAEVATGIVVGKIVSQQILSKVSFINDTKFVGSALRIIGGALLTSSMKGSFAKAAGLGIVADGVLNLVTTDLAIKVPGLSGFLPYKNVSGVLPYKNVSGAPMANPMIKIN